MAKYRFTLSIGYANARHDEQYEIPDEELAGLTPEQRDALVEERYMDWRSNYLDGGWEAIED